MKKLFLLCLAFISFSLIKAQDDIDTYYYQSSFITVGTGVDEEGVLVGAGTEFKLKKENLELTIMLEQEEALLLSKIYYDVYSGKNSDVYEYGEEIDVADLQWNYIYFSIEVEKKGKYAVELYNQDDIYINTLQFEVK